jgi:hypothetical protein
MAKNGYKVLRTMTPIADDADPLVALVAPADLAELENLQPDGIADVDGLSVYVEWLDAGDVEVPNDAGSAFDMTLVQIVDRRDESLSSPALAGKGLAISTTATGADGYTMFTIGNIRGADEFGVRLFNITEPAGATKMRFLYREL